MSTDLDLMGAGILCRRELPGFLRELSSTSHNKRLLKFHTHVRAGDHSVIAGLSDEGGGEVLGGHQSQADGTLDALDALMTRGLIAGKQHKISLRDLSDVRRDQHEERQAQLRTGTPKGVPDPKPRSMRPAAL
jgi:hypothetical protein